MRLSHKIFAFTFVIAATVLAAVAVHTVDQTTSLLTKESLGAALRHAEREAEVLYDTVEATVSDAQLLAAVGAARQMSDSFTIREMRGHRLELERIFSALMVEKVFYTQVRLIGLANNGRELVRVNREANRIRAVPEGRLQSKAHRYYVREAVRLGRGQTFVSKVDLNQEQGKIVTPHQPMLRISTPVIGGKGTLKGVIVINMDMNVLLREVVSLVPDGFSILTNCNGEYLYHPDNARTFAFEFGRHDRVQVDYGFEDDWRRWIKNPGGVPAITFKTSTDILSVARVDIPGAWDEADGVRTLVIGNVLPLTRFQQAGLELRDHLYVTLLVVCGFLGVSIAGATAWLTRPVTVLTRTANRIAAGEQGVKVSIASRDEVGALARALRRMLRALEEAARHKELAAMGRMAAMVAHDLRNALSAIKVNMQTLEAGCRHPSGQRERQWRLARDQIEYMENVLSDMLVFARPETLKRDWQDIRSLIEAATISLMREAAEKQVTISLDGLGILPPVWGDRTQLIRVYRNLTENALEALPPRGCIHFTGSVAMADTGNEVLIRITDNGEGMPPEVRKQVFTPFFTTRSNGTGLGLVIVQRIIEQHGGRVDFHSRRGEGTTFVLSLPTQPEDNIPDSRDEVDPGIE